MNCQKIREQLDAALDEQRVISSQANDPRHVEVLSHVESCSDCRVLYEEHLLIGTALAAWVPQRPNVDLTDRVIDAARQEGLVSTVRSVVRPSPAESSPQGRNIWPTIATVALVLVAVAIVFRENPGTIAVNDPAQEQVVPDQPPELFQQPQDQVADISHLVADAQSAWQGITSRVSHQASGFSVFVPDLKNELGISDDLNSAPDSDDSRDDAVPRKSTEPSAVEKAFEFLFKDDDSAGTLTI
jgi:negative regulator of sigma E activity